MPSSSKPFTGPSGGGGAPCSGTHARSLGSDRRTALLGIAVYCVLAVLIYLPVLPLDGHHLPGGGTGDPAQSAWFLAWTPHALLHHLNPFFTNFIDYPGGVNLMTNASTPALGVVAAPVTLLLGPVAALNLMLRVAFAASAASMFLVLRRWTRWWPAAFAGGLLYGFSPYMASQGTVHLHILFVALFPLMLAGLDDLFVAQRHDPRRVGVVLGLLAAVQLLISPELLSDGALLAAIGLLVLAAAHPREVRRRLRRARPGIVLAGGVFGLLAAYPVWFILRGPRHIVGPHQPVATLALFHADLLSPIVPTIHQRVAPSHLADIGTRLFAGNLGENGAYLGLPLILLVVALAIGWRRVGVVRLASLLAIVAITLSLGPRLTVDGHRLPLPLPFAVMTHLPVLESTVPGRFAVFVTLFVALILAVGLDRARRTLREPAARPADGRFGARWELAGVSLLVGLAFLALLPRPIRSESFGWPAQFPSGLARSVPAGAVILTYPFPASPHDEAMLWQAIARMHFRLVGGYAYIPWSGGTGSYYPPLDDPPAVQEIFGQAAERPSPYPPAPTLNATTHAQLREFIVKHSVDAVAVWPGTGSDPLLAERYVSGALGPPTARFGTAAVWSTRTLVHSAR